MKVVVAYGGTPVNQQVGVNTATFHDGKSSALTNLILFCCLTDKGA